MMKVEDLNKSHLPGAINVAQLLKDPIGSSRNYEIDTIIAEQPEGSITGKVTLIRTGQGILVRGSLNVQVELVCSRCLKAFPYPTNFAIEEEVHPSIDISSGLPLDLCQESEGFIIDKNHVLDLGELIRQYILLNLPMKALCQPDCAGIKEMKLYGST
jgi:uncharacterized protein